MRMTTVSMARFKGSVFMRHGANKNNEMQCNVTRKVMVDVAGVITRCVTGILPGPGGSYT